MHPARAAQAPTVPFAPLTPNQPAAPLRARAELASVLSSRLGGRLLTSDVVDLLTVTGAPDRPGLDHLSAAFRRAGYSVSLDHDPALGALPALAEMATGQIVLVLSRDADTLTLFDPTIDDRSADVPLADFTTHHSGWVLRVRMPFAEVEARHTDPEEAPHWFWS